MKAARTGVMAAAILATTAFAAAGQEARETGRVHRDWQEACEPGDGGREVCFIFQRLSYRGRTAANVTIGYKSISAGPVAVINMPLGAVLLPDGLRIETDGGVEGWAPFRFCDVRGCHVETELEPKLLAALKAGSQGWLVFRDLKEQEIRLPFSLIGLTAGLQSLSR